MMHWNIFGKKMVAKNIKKCSFAPLKGADALFSAVFNGLVAQLDTCLPARQRRQSAWQAGSS